MSGVEPQIIVVMGGTGDLMRRKLLPVLYRLTNEGAAQQCTILGVSRKVLSDDDYREIAAGALVEFGGVDKAAADAWAKKHVLFHSNGKGTMEDFRVLGKRLDTLDAANRVFYLALPPAAFSKTLVGLGEAGLNRGRGGWTRLVVEKPFGTDLGSAQALNELVHRHFDESQVYRIDHYLGKETVQNLLAFRFANAIFESLWNRDRIKRVEITVAESLGVETRAGYYDKSGALRDMMQNHLTQLLTLTAMEVPARFDADAIRTEKQKVLRSVVPFGDDDVVYGQYDGYLEEPGVAPGSKTETFVAMRIGVSNWRWEGVPFYLRTGKRLGRRVSQIAVTFRHAPVAMFGEGHANRLVITLQPDEGFDLQFDAKAPGEGFDLETQNLHFRYEEVFGHLPEAYETLLLDVMNGDQTLFVHADEVEASWRFYTPLIETPPEPHRYPSGSWGPDLAHGLLDGKQWWTR